MVPITGWENIGCICCYPDFGDAVPGRGQGCGGKMSMMGKIFGYKTEVRCT
jgi:hypothetical protein